MILARTRVLVLTALACLALGVVVQTAEAAGKRGPKGPRGLTGKTGKRGPTGIAGPVGAVGPQGPAGAPGAQGAAGPAGPQGADGAQGPQGEKGDRGEKGDKGDAGSYTVGAGLAQQGSTLLIAPSFSSALATGCPAGQALRTVTLAGTVECQQTAAPVVRYSAQGSNGGGAILSSQPLTLSTKTIADPVVAQASIALDVTGVSGSSAQVRCDIQMGSDPPEDQSVATTISVPPGASNASGSIALLSAGTPFQAVQLRCSTSTLPGATPVTQVTANETRFVLTPVGGVTG